MIKDRSTLLAKEAVMETAHDIRPYTNSLVERMFVATADQDYVLARWAAINRLDVNFFWLGLQSVEKYLKAILLFNGQSAKRYGHNIPRLYAEIVDERGRDRPRSSRCRLD